MINEKIDQSIWKSEIKGLGITLLFLVIDNEK